MSINIFEKSQTRCNNLEIDNWDYLLKQCPTGTINILDNEKNWLKFSSCVKTIIHVSVGLILLKVEFFLHF